MEEVCKVERKDTVRVLRLTRRSGSNMNFRKRTNKRDRMEGVTNPYHRETIGKSRNKMWSVCTLELDTLVEIIHGLSKPQADDQERGDTYKSICKFRVGQDEYFDHVPIMKPVRPIQADARWIIGLSSVADNLAPSLARKAIMVKRMKKTDENPRATAMKAGVVAVGADSQRDTSFESTERSKRGIRLGSVRESRGLWANRSWG